MSRKNTNTSDLTRRALLKAGGAFATGTLIGCGDFSRAEVGPEFRESMCVGGPSMTPDQLLAPIEHIVVVMMENRSFDHVFGSLSLKEGREDVDGLLGDETNPGPKGEDVGIFPLNPFQRLHHLPHMWEPMHQAFNQGRNNGFVLAHHDANKRETANAGPEVMGYLQRKDIPVSYALADAYSLCDQWHCSVMGPTWPNRFFLHAASSGGRKTNRPKLFLDTIWDQLGDADLRGLNYFSDIPWAAGGLAKTTGFARMSSFFKDAETGRLPEFSVIDPGFFSSTSDHPKEFGGETDHPEMGPNVNLGQLFIAAVYRALAESPKWNKTLLVVTYDESGGFFDHVAPPKTVDERDEFRQLGFRVPGLVIGPHVRSGCANHNLFEHCSILATATRRFGLRPLNARVEASADLSSAIDPELLTKPNAPIKLPQVEINMEDLIKKLEAVDTQPEMRHLAESGDIPPELDRRREIRSDVRDLVYKARDYGLVHPVKRFTAFSG